MNCLDPTRCDCSNCGVTSQAIQLREEVMRLDRDRKMLLAELDNAIQLDGLRAVLAGIVGQKAMVGARESATARMQRALREVDGRRRQALRRLCELNPSDHLCCVEDSKMCSGGRC